jgi:hypothetical protein
MKDKIIPSQCRIKTYPEITGKRFASLRGMTVALAIARKASSA